MFSNYIKIALRNLIRNKFYSLINILGLALGLACFIMIGIWLKDELSYDKNFKNSDRIYRIANDLITNGEPSQMACADPRIANHINAEYPEIEKVTRFTPAPSKLSYQDKNFFEMKTFFADTTFFEIFHYDFIHGNPKTALLSEESVVLSEDVAIKIFGNEDPMGKAISFSNRTTGEESRQRTVTGIIKNQSFNTHFTPKVIFSKHRYLQMFEYTYVLFSKEFDPKRFESEIWPAINSKHFEEEYKNDGQSLTLQLQPLTKIHLESNLLYELEPNGNIVNVYIFSIIAFFILLIASINYMNLATARSYSRSREVGVRKVLGATKKQLVFQFLTESITLSLLALILALASLEISLPLFNNLSEKTLSLNIIELETILSVLGLAIFVGFIAGIYPAFFISSFQPIKALKGTFDTSKNRFTFRKLLVVIQFSLSIIMLIATIVVSKQLNYVKNIDLGFNKEQVLVVSIEDPKMKNNTETFKKELLKNPNILQAAASHNIPGDKMYNFYWKFESPTGSMEPKLITTMAVDYDYIKLMNFELPEGTGYDQTMVNQLDTTIFIIVNNTAAQTLAWENPVGKNVHSSPYGLYRKGKCIGVVKDFNTASLHENIPPMLIYLSKEGFSWMSLKIKTTNISETIAYVEKIWKSFSQGYPFTYNFLDDSFNKQYAKEEKTNVLFTWFAGICVFICCLGLMGLASFTISQRTKEIGIRKISGASVTDIMILLSKDFLILVLSAIVIAIPIAFYGMEKWLQNFAYRTEIGWLVFFAAGASAIIISLATIGFHTFKAANRSPVKALRYE